MEPKTRLPSEVKELMVSELKAYRHECSLKQRPFSYAEAVENVYAVLEHRGLIEFTP